MARAKPITLGELEFARKGDAHAHLQTMLNRYRPGDRVTEADAVTLGHALDRHPDANEKKGVGVDHFMVRSADFGTQCFWVVRTDGSTERFSIKSCL